MRNLWRGGLLVQLTFYSPGQQQTLTFMPNSPAGELMPGASADPNEQRALPASFMDLPDAVVKLRAKGLRGKQIKTVHLENYESRLRRPGDTRLSLCEAFQSRQGNDGNAACRIAGTWQTRPQTDCRACRSCPLQSHRCSD
jgi:hypothetical protein